jgi:hypothetical protein
VTVVAAIARVPGRLIGMTAMVAGLGVGQAVIAAIAGALDDTGGTSTRGGELVFGLHAINALAIMAVSGNVARQARALARPPVPGAGSGPGRGSKVLGPTAGSGQPPA